MAHRLREVCCSGVRGGDGREVRRRELVRAPVVRCSTKSVAHTAVPVLPRDRILRSMEDYSMQHATCNACASVAWLPTLQHCKHCKHAPPVDNMTCGIPCRFGYHVGWDTMPGGIPSRVGYRR
jgi:hypothetical protein